MGSFLLYYLGSIFLSYCSCMIQNTRTEAILEHLTILVGSNEEVNLPLMKDPTHVLVILCAYLLFTLKVGPALMKKRDAFKLKNTLIVYNVIQVAVSAYLVCVFLQLMLKYGIISSTCQSDKEPVAIEISHRIWLYFAAKVFELLDTIFFVLRKKDNQVTFLHLYHHSIMMIGTWAYIKYIPADNGVVFIGFFNSLVHVFMYAYYGLAALGPSVAKYLAWKKYMTTFQLIQFVSMIVHYLANFLLSKCPPSKGVAVFISFNIIFFLALFTNFYRKSYSIKVSKSKAFEDSEKKSL